MLTSLAIIILVALLSYALFEKMKLPGILGFIFSGLMFGPHCLNFAHPQILEFTSEFKLLALIIILVRAGFSLKVQELKSNKDLVLNLSLLPLFIEALALALILHLVAGFSLIISLMTGLIVAPIAPAVVIPHMLRLKEDEHFPNKKIPNLLLASASLDNVWVLSLFGVLATLATQTEFTLKTFMIIPVSLINGILLGILIGFILINLFKKFSIRDTKKVFIILFLCVLIKEAANAIPLSSYLAIIGATLIILIKHEDLAHRLAQKFSKLWILAELLLFVLIGLNTDFGSLVALGPWVILLVLGGILVRYGTMILSLKNAPFTPDEKRYAASSFIPKATIQAALGGIPLSLGLPHGHFIMALSTLSILLSVPLGTMLCRFEYKKLCKKPNTTL